ncbi:hypothetical protein MMC12_007557 [Toensbergia leucococca]|nr:hypothetical protein [Toensbergia leucococca]
MTQRVIYHHNSNVIAIESFDDVRRFQLQTIQDYLPVLSQMLQYHGVPSQRPSETIQLEHFLPPCDKTTKEAVQSILDHLDYAERKAEGVDLSAYLEHTWISKNRRARHSARDRSGMIKIYKRFGIIFECLGCNWELFTAMSNFFVAHRKEIRSKDKMVYLEALSRMRKDMSSVLTQLPDLKRKYRYRREGHLLSNPLGPGELTFGGLHPTRIPKGFIQGSAIDIRMLRKLWKYDRDSVLVPETKVSRRHRRSEMSDDSDEDSTDSDDDSDDDDFLDRLGYPSDMDYPQYQGPIIDDRYAGPRVREILSGEDDFGDAYGRRY